MTEHPADADARLDVFPHVENCMSMTLREWLYFHNVMHRHYTHYRGRKMLKPPFDWVVLGDIIDETRPELIIEIGSYEGATTLWMADHLDALGSDASIIGIDIRRPPDVDHPRISWVTGDCTQEAVFARAQELAGERRGLVIEDSDHKFHVTKKILELYNPFVAPGNYLIVEDTIVEFMQLPPFPGPLQAVKEFVAANPEFVVDRTREKYILTYNPMGYLLRRR
jgi:cephalosporin hydroxylase